MSRTIFKGHLLWYFRDRHIVTPNIDYWPEQLQFPELRRMSLLHLYEPACYISGITRHWPVPLVKEVCTTQCTENTIGHTCSLICTGLRYIVSNVFKLSRLRNSGNPYNYFQHLVGFNLSRWIYWDHFQDEKRKKSRVGNDRSLLKSKESPANI